MQGRLQGYAEPKGEYRETARAFAMSACTLHGHTPTAKLLVGVSVRRLQFFGNVEKGPLLRAFSILYLAVVLP